MSRSECEWASALLLPSLPPTLDSLEARLEIVTMVLFTSLAAAAALAGSSHASPLFRRQGGSSGLPANATIPNGSGNNITYEVVPTSSNGTSFVNATVESVPLGVNATGWNVTYTNSSEPYEGAHLILGEHQLLSLYPRR